MLTACAGAALASLLACQPKTAPTPPDHTEWEISNTALDSDTICLARAAEDQGLKVCRSVGEVRAFLRSLKAN